MKKLAFLLAVGFIAGHAHAISGVTKGGHAACLSKEWFNDVVSFSVANDKGSFEAYVDSKKCVILKSGLRVTVTESPGMFGGTVGFVYQWIKFWTAREALEYSN